MSPPPWQKQTLAPAPAGQFPGDSQTPPPQPVFTYPYTQLFFIPPGTQIAGQPIFLATPIPNLQQWSTQNVLPTNQGQPILLPAAPIRTEQRTNPQTMEQHPIGFCPTAYHNPFYMGTPNVQNVEPANIQNNFQHNMATAQSIYPRSIISNLTPSMLSDMDTKQNVNAIQNVDRRQNINVSQNMDPRYVFENKGMANSPQMTSIYHTNMTAAPPVFQNSNISKVTPSVLTNMDSKPSTDIKNEIIIKDTDNVEAKLDILRYVIKMNEPANAHIIAPDSIPGRMFPINVPHVASNRDATSNTSTIKMQPNSARIIQPTVTQYLPRIHNLDSVSTAGQENHQIQFQNIPPLVRMHEHPSVNDRINHNCVSKNLDAFGNKVIENNKSTELKTQEKDVKVHFIKSGQKTTTKLHKPATVVNNIEQDSEKNQQTKHFINSNNSVRYQDADGTRFFILPKQATENTTLFEHKYGTMSVIPWKTENLTPLSTKSDSMQRYELDQKELLRNILTKSHASTNTYENNNYSLKVDDAPKYINCGETQPYNKTNLPVTNDPKNSRNITIADFANTDKKKTNFEILNNNEISLKSSIKMENETVEYQKVVNTTGSLHNIENKTDKKTNTQVVNEGLADVKQNLNHHPFSLVKVSDFQKDNLNFSNSKDMDATDGLKSSEFNHKLNLKINVDNNDAKKSTKTENENWLEVSHDVPKTATSQLLRDTAKTASNATNESTINNDKSNCQKQLHAMNNSATNATKTGNFNRQGVLHNVTKASTNTSKTATDKVNGKDVLHGVAKAATNTTKETIVNSANCQELLQDVAKAESNAVKSTTDKAKGQGIHGVAKAATNTTKAPIETNCQVGLYDVAKQVIPKYSDAWIKDLGPVSNAKSIAKKYNILTHVIDGLVIQEADVPFPIRRPLQERFTQVDTKNNAKKTEKLRQSLRNKKLHAKQKVKKVTKIVKDDSTTLAGKQTEKDTTADLDPTNLKSWSCGELQTYLRDWCWCKSFLLEHEVDGLALTLASCGDLQRIGLHPAHAQALHDFAATGVADYCVISSELAL